MACARWPRALAASSVFAVCPVVASLPESLHFEPRPHLFEKWWDDAQHLEDEALVCAANGGGSACSQTALPDQHVKDRIDGVRDYYNSDRTINLMSSEGPSSNKSFHSPFSIYGIDDGQYLLVLAGLRSDRRPFPLKKTRAKLNVLDYGCGLGAFARSVAETGCCNVFCVNIAQKQVEQARSLTPLGDVLYEVYDGHKFPYASGFFDAIFFQESYTFHTPNQCDIAREFGRVLKPGGRLVGLDWMTAAGLTEDEYRYWIGPINIAWEASTGMPENVARCLRQAGLERLVFKDTARMGGIPDKERPRNHFMNLGAGSDDEKFMEHKYGTMRGQLSIASFNERDRYIYALEAMALAIKNQMYWSAFVVAHKPVESSTASTSLGSDP